MSENRLFVYLIRFVFIIFITVKRLVFKGLDGFLMLVSVDNKILYISETVNDHLGLNWVRKLI